MTTLRTADDLSTARPPLGERLRVVVRQGVLGTLAGRARAGTSAAATALNRTTTLQAAGDMTEWGSVQMFADYSAHRLRAGTGALVVDLSEVERADTKLIACLVFLASTARQASRPIRFHFSPSVRAWVSLCGLERVLVASAGRAG